MTSRKDFLKTAAWGTTGLLVGWPAAAFRGTTLKTKVIIVGAGLSGLAAAHALKKKNVEFVLLESRKRIGGRVFSHQITDDLVIELGGEWVGFSHERIRTLCEEYGLELENNQFDTHLIYKGVYAPAGKWDYSAKWNARFQQLLKDYHQLDTDAQQQLDQKDWWRYLVEQGCQGRDLDIRELLDSTDFGESIRQVSAFAALAEYAESSEKNEMDLKIKGGNSRLAEKLLEKAGRQHCYLDHTVTRIEQKEGVRVSCSNGKQFEADTLICTIPGFSLLGIDWEPALPPDQKAALEALQYARINKHALVFNQRFWKQENFDMITDQLPHYFYHGTKNQHAKAGVLISYSIGDKAAVIANQDKQQNARMIEQTLGPHFGPIQPLIEKQVNYYWGNDALSKGAYAIYGRGQWFGLRPVLQKPFLNTLFAGEHLADWQGFMEGAIQTGEAAAALAAG